MVQIRGVLRGRVWQSINSGASKKMARTPAEKTAKPGRRKGFAATRRVMALAKGKTAKTSKTVKTKAHGDPMPDFIPAALATLWAAPPTETGWLHEVKFDGYRIQARLDHGEVRLLTRKGLDWTGKFANIAAAVADLPAETALLDGELVVEDENGISTFSALQADLKAGRHDRFVYYAFDLLYLDGTDLRRLPLLERKAALVRLLRHAKQHAGPIRLSEHFDDEGSLVLRQACRMKLEGIVSKRRDAPYISGRSEHLIKVKCANRQECQSGQIMSAAALLKDTPKPSDADIDAAMSGNVCRCGTYQRIRAAIHRAAA